jgi:ABC-2 type transport system permease protein
VPFSSPIAMPVRLFQGDAAAWEPVVSLVLLAHTALAVLAIGARS